MLTTSSTLPAQVHESSRPRPVGLRFRSILVATDCSATSATAVKLAARIAKEFHSKLYVLHAIMPELYAIHMAGPVPDLKLLSLQNAHDNLHRYAQRIPELRSVKHKEIVFFGSATEGIQFAGESNGIDLLVLGSHGREGLAKLTLGSIAEWAVGRLPYPVLVAGPRCNKTLHSIRSIVLAIDLSEPGFRAAEYASSIAQEHNATLTVVTVLSQTGEKDEEPEDEQRAVGQLHRLLPSDVEDWCSLEFDVRSGEVAPAILECARQTNANMIVLGARHKPALADHLPRTRLSTIIRGAPCPVLLVPANPS